VAAGGRRVTGASSGHPHGLGAEEGPAAGDAGGADRPSLGGGPAGGEGERRAGQVVPGQAGMGRYLQFQNTARTMQARARRTRSYWRSTVCRSRCWRSSASCWISSTRWSRSEPPADRAEGATRKAAQCVHPDRADGAGHGRAEPTAVRGRPAGPVVVAECQAGAGIAEGIRCTGTGGGRASTPAVRCRVRGRNRVQASGWRPCPNGSCPFLQFRQERRERRLQRVLAQARDECQHDVDLRFLLPQANHGRD
jgi:hypothetical protein